MIDTCPYVHPPDVMGYQDAFGSGAAHGIRYLVMSSLAVSAGFSPSFRPSS
jgi:hypothetical protein